MVMADIWTLVSVLACAVTFIRVITWKATGERFRLDMSLGAYALALCTGGHALTSVLHALAGHPVAAVSPWISMVLVWLSVLVVLAKGNVARILQLNWSRPWDGSERRRG